MAEVKTGKVKVEVIANIKYGQDICVIGQEIEILSTELKKFEELKLVKKIKA